MRCRSEQPQRKELRYWLARAHEGTGRSAACAAAVPGRAPRRPRLHGTPRPGWRRSPKATATTTPPTLAGLAQAGLGPECPDGLDPLFGTEERDLEGLRAPTPRRPAHAPLPPLSGPSASEKPDGPDPSLPTGPTDPALLEEALAELERMVGLEPVKRQVKALSAQLNMARLRAGQGLPVQPPKRHFVFSGPSGTGKTTVARILGRVSYALGLLGGDHLVEAQRADLVGEYLGQTA